MLPTVRLFIISLAFFTGLSACATPRVERVARKSALDIRFEKSEEAVSYWRKERYWKFRTDESSLIREISLLQNHPGWPDMEKIIKAMPSIQYLEGQDSAQRKSAAKIAEWSQKWSASGQHIYNKYAELVRRSIEMIKRGNALLDEWRTLNAEQLAIILERLANTRGDKWYGWKMAAEWNETTDSKTQGELMSLEIDSIGLYQRRSR